MNFIKNFFKTILARIDNLGRVDNDAVYAALPGFTGKADHATLGTRIEIAKVAEQAARRRVGLEPYAYKH